MLTEDVAGLRASLEVELHFCVDFEVGCGNEGDSVFGSSSWIDDGALDEARGGLKEGGHLGRKTRSFLLALLHLRYLL